MCTLENTVPIVGVVGMGYFPDGKEFVFVPKIMEIMPMRSPSAQALAKALKCSIAEKCPSGRLSMLPAGEETAFGGVRVYKLNRQNEAEFVSAYNLA